jgi:hypothetical protein
VDLIAFVLSQGHFPTDIMAVDQISGKRVSTAELKCTSGAEQKCKQTLTKGRAIVRQAFGKGLSKLLDKERQSYINLHMKMQ